MSLYKRASAADEIAVEMTSNLKLNRLDEQYSIKRLAVAIDHLNSAAEIFDTAGRVAEAETIVSLIAKLGAPSDFDPLPATHEDYTLTPHERAFFDKLPHHHKERLKKLDMKAFRDAVRDMAATKQVEKDISKHKQHSLTGPEAIHVGDPIAMESEVGKEVPDIELLLGRGNQLPQTDRDDEIITIGPIPKGASVADIAAILTGKKKAR